MYPEIAICIQMLQFSVYQSNKFCQKSAFYPVLIVLCKLIGAMAAEIGNVYMLVRYTTVKSCVGGYVTMAILSKVDDIMALTLTNANISGDLSSHPTYYRKARRVFDDLDLIKKWIKNKTFNLIQFPAMILVLLLMRGMRFVYVSIYFYFLPFLCILFTELALVTKHLETDNN